MLPITIKYRKIGRHANRNEKLQGLAWKQDRIVEVDSRLEGKDKLTTLIHEITHIQNPKWAEIKVEGHSKQLADLLWDQNLRFVQP
jgi:hypothetical protein